LTNLCFKTFSLAVVMIKKKVFAICCIALIASVVLTSCGRNAYGKQCLCPVRKAI
jgi:hypothetical protein